MDINQKTTIIVPVDNLMDAPSLLGNEKLKPIKFK